MNSSLLNFVCGTFRAAFRFRPTPYGPQPGTCILIAALLLLSSNLGAAEPGHVLWSVQGKTNTVYLLGSMHFLPSAEQLPQPMLEAYREAEKVVMEVDMDDLDPFEVQTLTLQQGILPPDQTLEQQLGKDVYARVVEHMDALELDPIVVQRMRPWLAGLTLTQLHLMKLGWTPQSGVEQQLVRLAARDNKEIIGLETFGAQIQLLASLPAERQREFLLYSVGDADKAAQEINALTTAWRTGDIEALEDLLEAGFREYPDLYEPLTVARNRAWIPRITTLLQHPDDYLIVVGSAHLVGDDSVLDLLERAGFKVTRH